MPKRALGLTAFIILGGVLPVEAEVPVDEWCEKSRIIIVSKNETKHVFEDAIDRDDCKIRLSALKDEFYALKNSNEGTDKIANKFILVAEKFCRQLVSKSDQNYPSNAFFLCGIGKWNDSYKDVLGSLHKAFDSIDAKPQEEECETEVKNRSLAKFIYEVKRLIKNQHAPIRDLKSAGLSCSESHAVCYLRSSYYQFNPESERVFPYDGQVMISFKRSDQKTKVCAKYNVIGM